MEDTTTEQRLRLLKQEFIQHPATGPGDGRSSRPTVAPAPLDLAVVDRIGAAVAEMERHTRAVAPTAGPYTGDDTRVYLWSRRHTAHLDTQNRQAIEAIIYRQGLEHALAIGDTTVIRQHPCPHCGCWGLFWREAAGEAVCVNRNCAEGGVSRTWSLARLAQQHIAGQETFQTRAT